MGSYFRTHAVRIIVGVFALAVLAASMVGAATAFGLIGDSSPTANPTVLSIGYPLEAQSSWRAKDFVIVGTAAGFVLLLGVGAWVVKRRGDGW